MIILRESVSDKERFEDNSEIILFLDENICCDNSLEPSRRESFYN